MYCYVLTSKTYECNHLWGYWVFYFIYNVCCTSDSDFSTVRKCRFSIFIVYDTVR